MNKVQLTSLDKGLIFTPEVLEDLRREYKLACELEQDTFTFAGRELATGYAKYLIIYLEQTL